MGSDRFVLKAILGYAFPVADKSNQSDQQVSSLKMCAGSRYPQNTSQYGTNLNIRLWFQRGGGWTYGAATATSKTATDWWLFHLALASSEHRPEKMQLGPDHDSKQPRELFFIPESQAVFTET